MSSNFSSSDKASKKQLAWERGREDFMQGNNWKKIKQQHKKQRPGQQPAGKQHSGKEPAGKQHTGKQSSGKQHTGKQPPKKKQKR